MKTIYSCSLIALIAILHYMLHEARKRDTRMVHVLSRLCAAASVVVISSMLAIILPNEEVALFMQTLHYASTEWMLIYLLFFLESYTDNVEGNFAIKLTVFIVSFACSVNLLLNCVYHHVVYCYYDWRGGELYRMFKATTGWYRVHEYFSYILAICSLLVLLKATVAAVSFYRVKYYPAVIALIITMGMEVICNVFNAHMDYALFGYVGLAIFLVYHSNFHSFSGLVAHCMTYVVDDSGNAVVCFDMNNNCIHANHPMYKMHPEANALMDFEKIFAEYEYGKDKEDATWTMETGEGERRQIYEVTYANILGRRGQYAGCYFKFNNRTEELKNYEEANFRATHDTLTGLSNRESFIKQVKTIRNKNIDRDYYVIAADIKDFKLINDLFGFRKGNEILIAFANAMKASLPSNAICCRMNSDHFAFCVAKDDFSERRIIRNLKGIEDKFEDNNYQLIYHFGIYEIVQGDSDVSVMYDHARMALAVIKNEYQQMFSYYADHIMIGILRERQLVAEFEGALATRQFMMFIQPQVKPGGDAIGGEALVRWRHPEYGMVSPGEFIPVFEKSGLIYKLDQYMWDAAARKLAEWKAKGYSNYHISVNISPKDFYYLDIYQTFVDLVEKYDISPKCLKLEITESAFMNDPQKQLELIARLQNYGFQVEIDDFGSGYSSLNMLKEMKADVLKIDMGFLRKVSGEVIQAARMEEGSDDSEAVEEIRRSLCIIDTVMELAKRLGMIVITEGVETKEQADYLTDIGCDIFQGYYFAKPMAVNEFEEKYF